MSNESGSAADHEARKQGAKPFGDFADKAVDIETAHAFVQEAASVASGIWVTYLGILAYLAITVGAVTHADLFLQRPVKLPLLDAAPVPLVAFFALAPIIFVIWHAYTLLHFDILAEKVRVLEGELGDLAKRAEGADTQFRWRLPANIFVQYLAGHPRLRKGRIGVVSWIVAWGAMVFGPILLLLLVQVQFLPYHGERVTWLHRALVLIDLALLWTFWPVVVTGGKEIWSLRGSRPVLLAISIVALIFSVPLATFPGESLDAAPAIEWFAPWFQAKDEFGCPVHMTLHDWLFNGPYDPRRHRRQSLFSNTLILPEFDLLEERHLEQAKLGIGEYTLVRRGGHFEGAIFRGADLRKINLEYANLQGADLAQANLQSAQLHAASLDGATLSQTHLQLASLAGARARGAYLKDAELEGADLRAATLQVASLTGARLELATLPETNLRGASLKNAQLQGAEFRSSDAPSEGAILRGADFSGAVRKGTKLEDQSLADAFRGKTADEKPTTEEALEADLKSIDAAPETWQTKDARARAQTLKKAENDTWRGVSSDTESQQRAISESLKPFVCSGDAESPVILHGLIDGMRREKIQDVKVVAEALTEMTCDTGKPTLSRLSEVDRSVFKFVRERLERDEDKPQSCADAGDSAEAANEH